MKTPDHPNALWLRAVYVGAADIKRNDSGRSPEQVESAMRELVAAVSARFSPTFVLHTGGRRLAATGGGDFMQRYSARRAALSGGSFRTVAIHEVVADDHYGLVTGQFSVERDGVTVDMTGMGAWRFADGLAVEHWEMPDCDVWDEFFLAVDPDLVDGNAEEYWRRAV